MSSGTITEWANPDEMVGSQTYREYLETEIERLRSKGERVQIAIRERDGKIALMRV